MNIQEFERRLNQWGQDRTPFLFVVDFEMEKPFACPLEDAAKEGIFFQINRLSNFTPVKSNVTLSLVKHPISFTEYERKFERVATHLHYGDSFLTNLTLRTRLKTPHTLTELFHRAHAPFKLLFRESFLVFSPEPFVQIAGQRIFTYPMKGTIDANLPDARTHIMNDPKELAEHITIVDLMRNDLSRVATGVRVARFRFIDEIRTNDKKLLQVSSEIVGDLPADFHRKLGTLLVQLLPAGSVSGAPKDKTLAIIREAEEESRNYYTGVFGYFDGEKMESAVMIRFIERMDSTLYYRSGGGITAQSVALHEYQEAIDKVYVPIH